MHDFRYQQCSLVTIESSIEHFLRIGSIKFFNQTLLAKTLWCTRLARVPCCLQARHHETRWTHIQRGKANQTRVIDSGNVLELGSHKIMVDVKNGSFWPDSDWSIFCLMSSLKEAPTAYRLNQEGPTDFDSILDPGRPAFLWIRRKCWWCQPWEVGSRFCLQDTSWKIESTESQDIHWCSALEKFQ